MDSVSVEWRCWRKRKELSSFRFFSTFRGAPPGPSVPFQFHFPGGRTEENCAPAPCSNVLLSMEEKQTRRRLLNSVSHSSYSTMESREQRRQPRRNIETSPSHDLLGGQSPIRFSSKSREIRYLRYILFATKQLVQLGWYTSESISSSHNILGSGGFCFSTMYRKTVVVKLYATRLNHSP